MSLTHRTRAFTLMEIVYLVPIVAAASLVTYEATTHTLRFERRMMEDVAGDARRADLVRRMAQDADRARTATLEQSDGVVALELRDCSPPSTQADEDRPVNTAAADASTIRYRVVAGEVTRVEQKPNSRSEIYTWSLQPGGMELAIEKISGEPRLVWVSFTKSQQREQGPELTQKLTTAMRIGGAR